MSVPTVAVAGDAVPSDRQVRIDIEVVEQFSDDAPARLRVRFTNEAPAGREFLFGAVSPFGPVACDAAGGGSVHVVPESGTAANAGSYADVVPDSPVDGCWRLLDWYDSIDRGILWRADAGETTSTIYAVLSDPESEDCLPPGEYRFEAEWGERSDGEEVAWYPWGFTLVSV